MSFIRRGIIIVPKTESLALRSTGLWHNNHSVKARFLTNSINTPKPRTLVTTNQIANVGREVPFKILRDVTQVSGAPLDKIELNDVSFRVGKEDLEFNLTWLRDSCHCHLCTHQYSRQRLFTPEKFRRDIFSITDARILEGQSHPGLIKWPKSSLDCRYLNVIWVDGHQSLYSLGWLKEVHELYAKRQLQIDGLTVKHKFACPKDDLYGALVGNRAEPILWEASQFKASVVPVKFSDLVDGFKFNDDPNWINANKLDEMTSIRHDAIYSLTRQLVTYGLAKIVDVPLERNQVANVVKSLAYERPTGYGSVFDVVVEPSEDINLAYSSQEFDLHSDLTYREISPGVQLLHCITNSINGGYSYFSDANNAAQVLRQTDPRSFEVLTKFPVTFVVRDPYRNLKFRKRQPIISLNSEGIVGDIYYSPFMLPPLGHKDDLKLFYSALAKMTKLLHSDKNKLIVKMDPGDMFMFHNRRVLHGRSSYDPRTNRRFLQGCYMDWDEIESLFEKMQSNKS